MTAVLVIARDESRRAQLRRALPGVTLFAAAGDAEALDLLRFVEVDLVVRDSATRGYAEFRAALRRLVPHARMLALGSADPDLDADAVLAADASPHEFEAAVHRAVEGSRLDREVAALRARVDAASASAGSGALATAADPSWDSAALARVLKEVTRVFAIGFDLPRALDVFLDAIAELVRPSRMALLLPDEPGGGGVFRIRVHRSLSRPIVDAVQLHPNAGLLQWFRRHGRPARLGELEPDVARTLALLQAVVAVPLTASGELVGVLTLGPPVVRAEYGAREIETLFDLATHLAAAMRNITLHQQLGAEKDFSERILAHMSNGVVTLGRDERIGMMNGRAAEILGMSAPETVGRDLRMLPSPLGDMLYETMTSGRSRPRTELQLALGGRWLEVSTYPIMGDGAGPLGAALVFEDLTAQKALAAEKRQADQLQLLTRVVARIADEVKNPLVSIHTFVELIDERFEDQDFRKEFGTVVRRDIRRVVHVFEKLVGLVSDRELHYSTVDVAEVIEDVAVTLHTGDGGDGPVLNVDVQQDTAPHCVNVDTPELRKALTYLVGYLAHNSEPKPCRVSIGVARGGEGESASTVRVLIGSPTAKVPAPTLERLFDPVHMVQESLIDVGPAVSQRIIEAQGGRLRVRQTRHDFSFLVTLPAAG